MIRMIIIVTSVIMSVLVLITYQYNLKLAKLKQQVKSCQADLASCQEEQKCLRRKPSPEELLKLILPYAKDYIPIRLLKDIVAASQNYSTQRTLLLLALITVESHFDPFARSPSGAVGCAQIKPQFWLDALIKDRVVKSKRDLFDPALCLAVADYVLKKYEQEADGDISLALAYYQCGPKNEKCLAKTGQAYARKVLEQYALYSLQRR